jgi:hypothetical protein
MEEEKYTLKSASELAQTGGTALEANLDAKISDAPEQDIEQLEAIKDTAGFDKAIIEGRVQEAEDWLLKAKDTKYIGNDRWLRHRSETLYHLYREAGDFVAAKRMVEILAEGEAKDGRKMNLSLIAKRPYEQI